MEGELQWTVPLSDYSLQKRPRRDEQSAQRQDAAFHASRPYPPRLCLRTRETLGEAMAVGPVSLCAGRVVRLCSGRDRQALAALLRN